MARPKFKDIKYPNKNQEQMVCENCGYKWIPISLRVKACPKCKVYFNYDNETAKVNKKADDKENENENKNK